MRVHELHAATFHAPLVLMPAAAAADVTAALGGPGGPRLWSRVGRVLWWLAAGAGVATAIAGMAAIPRPAGAAGVGPEAGTDKQEGCAPEMLWLHGAGSSALLLAGLTLVARRSVRRPRLVESLLALVASGAGIGAACGTARSRRRRNAARAGDRAAALRSPPLLSWAAPRAFVRDAARGLTWFAAQTARVLRGQPLCR